MQSKVTIPKETVKTLAKAIGLRPAARQLGLDENLVLQWSKRDPEGSWAIEPKDRTQNVITPSKALADTLLERKDKSALHLSKYVTDAAENAACSEGEIKIAQDVRHVAAIRSSLWPEEKQEAGINLNVLSIGGDMAIQINQKGLGNKPDTQGE